METQQVIDRMRARLFELLAEVERADPALHPLAERLRVDISRQFRIAVVGRVKAGKSTLVNALIGRNVAATSAEECTRFVTEYRYGAPYRAELVLRSGERRSISPSELAADEPPLPPSEVSHAEVFLPEAALQHFTLVDTPGLSTTTTDNQQATNQAVLGIDSPERGIDAMAYVVRGNEYADEVAFLQAFAANPSTPGKEAVIGILSQADVYGTGPWGDADPMTVATRAASEMAGRRYGEMAAVIALSGLMAEAARTGKLREDDARALARLSTIDDDSLRDWDIPAELEESANLLADAMGEYGVRHGREVARGGLEDLENWLAKASGISLLDSVLRSRNLGRFPVDRARAALDELIAAVPNSAHRARLRALIAEVRSDPALHPVLELEAWESLRGRPEGGSIAEMLARALDAPDDLARVSVAAGSPTPVVRDAAIRRAGEAQAAAALAHGSIETRAASVAARSFGLVAERYS